MTMFNLLQKTFNKVGFYYILLCPLIIFPLNTYSSIDSLKKVLNKTTKKDRLIILNKITEGYLVKNIDSAFFYADKLIKEIPVTDNSLEQGKAYFNYAACQYYKGHIDSAQIYFTKALEKYKQTDNISKIALTINNIALTYNDRGKYFEALQKYKEALEMFEFVGNDSRIALLSNNIGVAYMEQGLYNKAVSYYQKSLTYYKKAGKEKAQLNVLINIANVYYKWGYKEKSIEYYEKAYKLLKDGNNYRAIAGCYNNLGEIYFEKNDYKNAINYLLKADSLFQKTHFYIGSISAKNNLADVYFNLNQYDKMLYYYQESSKIAKENNINKKLSYTLFNKGKALYLLNKEEEALINITEAFNIAKENNYTDILVPIYSFFAEYYQEQHNYKKALSYKNQYILLKDSIFNKESHDELELLEKKIQYEQKENEITQKNLEIKIQKQKINRQKIIIYLTVLMLLITLTLASFIYLLYRKKKKLSLLLQEQNNIILEQQEELELKFEKSETLNTELKQFSLTAHDINDMIVLMNKDGKIEWTNKAFSVITGYTSDTVPGKARYLLKADEFKKNILPSEKTLSITTDIETINNINKKIKLRITPIKDETGKVSKYMLIGTDISVGSKGIETPQQTTKIIDDEKLRNLNLDDNLSLKINKLINENDKYKTRLLANKGPALVPVNIKDIAYIFTENKIVYLISKTKVKFVLNNSLDELEKMLNPILFYRANRQFLLSINSVTKVEAYSANKLMVSVSPPINHDIIISRAKATEFKNWLAGKD